MENKKHILVIDDEVELRGCIVDLLESEGYFVTQAENGRDALNQLQNTPLPKLIILDYMMPVLDGKGFCEEKQKNPLIKDIPVILLTAATISPDKLENLILAAHLNKPINLDLFLDIISTFF